MDIAQQKDRLQTMLQKAVPDHAESLLSLARPSVRLFSNPDGEVELLGSRFGGLPALPSAEAWPATNERPLVFLCQIRLDELAGHQAAEELPDTGLLSFFTAGMWMTEEDADSMFDDYGSVGTVLYQPDVSDLTPQAPPWGEDETAPFPVSEAAMRFEEELCLPPVEGPDIDHIGFKGTDAHSAYWDQVWMERLVHDDEPFHRLLGYPDMNFNYHMKGQRLLLQFDSDMDIGWELGDYQAIRFILPQSALDSADFSPVWCNADEE